MSCIYLSALEPCSWTTCTDTGHALCHDNLLKAHIPHAQPPVNRLAMTSMLEARYTHVLSKKQHEAIQTCRYTCNYVTMQNILLHLVHMETYSSYQKKLQTGCKWFLKTCGLWSFVNYLQSFVYQLWTSQHICHKFSNLLGTCVCKPVHPFAMRSIQYKHTVTNYGQAMTDLWLFCVYMYVFITL